jgi:hypothetical protein
MQHCRGSTAQQQTRGQAGRQAMIMPQQAEELCAWED